MKFLKINKIRFLICILLCPILFNSMFALAQEENLNIFYRWIEWSDGKNMLIHHLNKQAFGYLDMRDEEISKLKTKVDWLNRQRKVKDILMDIVGPFPEKTPLNPKITGIIRKDGYRIEKIVSITKGNNIAFFCSEKDYKKCHRFWKITPELEKK